MIAAVSRETVSPVTLDRPTDLPAQGIADLVAASRTQFGGLDPAAVAQGVVASAGQDLSLAERLTGDVANQLSPLEQGSWLDKIIDLIKQIIENAKAPLPPTASDSASVPGLEAIANDPAVRAAINGAWTNSNPNTPGEKQETGFWVVRDDAAGQLSTIPFPSNGTRDSLTPGPVPNEPGKTVVAFFHTHPNTTDEGYISGPSPADLAFAKATGIPGIIRSHDGMYYFDPPK